MKKIGRYIFTKSEPEKKGVITLYRGSCATVLSMLPKQNVSCWITSPPYFRQRKYTDSEMEIGTEENLADYLLIMGALAEQFRFHTASGGTFWMVVGDTRNLSGGQGGDYLKEDGQYRLRHWEGAREKDPPTALLRVPARLVEVFVDAGWFLVNEVILDKQTSRRSAPRRLCDSTERLLVFAKDTQYKLDRNAVLQEFSETTKKQLRSPAQPKQRTKKEIIEGAKKRPGAYLRDVWRIPRTTSVRVDVDGETLVAPAPINETVVKMALALGAPEGKLVADPFAGFGTVLLEAAEVGHPALGVELGKDAVRAARKRAEERGLEIRASFPEDKEG